MHAYRMRPISKNVLDILHTSQFTVHNSTCRLQINAIKLISPRYPLNSPNRKNFVKSLSQITELTENILTDSYRELCLRWVPKIHHHHFALIYNTCYMELTDKQLAYMHHITSRKFSQTSHEFQKVTKLNYA